MDDGTALLTAIIAYPDEDVPRLMYADWLEEHGQAERAEFIRAQVEDARLCERLASDGNPIGLRNPQHKKVFKRSIELQRQFGREWFPFPNEHGHLGFGRGFVDLVRMTAADWLIHADLITAAHPVTAVTFTTRLDWEMQNYDAYLREHGNPDVPYQCRPMHPDIIDKALSHGIEVVLRHEWPGVRVWSHPPEPEIHANPFGAPELQAAFQMVQRGMGIDRDWPIRSLGLPPHLIGDPSR